MPSHQYEHLSTSIYSWKNKCNHCCYCLSNPNIRTTFYGYGLLACRNINRTAGKDWMGWVNYALCPSYSYLKNPVKIFTFANSSILFLTILLIIKGHFSFSAFICTSIYMGYRSQIHFSWWVIAIKDAI